MRKIEFLFSCLANRTEKTGWLVKKCFEWLPDFSKQLFHTGKKGRENLNFLNKFSQLLPGIVHTRFLIYTPLIYVRILHNSISLLYNTFYNSLQICNVPPSNQTAGLDPQPPLHNFMTVKSWPSKDCPITSVSA